MSEIKTLSSRHSPAGQPLLRILEAYWRGMCENGRLPRRRAIDPARIDVVLPHAFVLQRIAPGHGRIRAAGQRVAQLAGEDARGLPLGVFFTAAARPILTDHLRAVFDRPAIVELPLEAPRSVGAPRLRGRLLLLPLRGEDDTVSAALGALITEGRIGAAPRRFDILAGERLRCDPVPQPRPAFPPAPGAGAQAGALMRPHRVGRPILRLVVDNG